MRLKPTLVVVLGLAAGCALKGDVRKVELQVEAARAERARADAERAAQIDSLRLLLAALQQALTAQQAYLVQLRGDVRTDLLAVQQQLVQVQELTGQSQQRLSELRARIEERAQQPVPPLDTTGRGAPVSGGVPPVGPSGNPAGPGPDQMYDLSLQQFRRGSLATARLGFREFLRIFPKHEHAADALFYVGETWASENADSAAGVYQQVVKTHPNSPRAPAALYKLGLLAEQRGDKAAARTYYARVIAGYPRSDEANLAREVGLVGAGIAGDHPGVIRAGRRLIRTLLREETQLVESRGGPRRIGVGLHHLLIHGSRGVGVFACPRLPHIEQGVGSVLVGGEHAQEFPEADASGGKAAAAELLQGQVVHLVRAGPGRIPRRPDRRAGARPGPPRPPSPPCRVERRHGLLGALFDARPQLAQALLALAGQLLHLDELLLDGEQVGADVPFQGASGGEPQDDDQRRLQTHLRLPHGCRRASPPAMISNSSRRFCAHADSSWPCASGRSSP